MFVFRFRVRFIVLGSLAVAAVTVNAADPRLQPVAPATFTEEQRALTAAHGGEFGLGADLRVLLIHPELVKGVLPFANYILSGSTLTPRHRELLILRSAWRTRSQYLWAKHQERGLAAGLSAAEIAAIGGRPGASFDRHESALLRAADELHQYSFVSDDAWQVLQRTYGVHELMDAAFTVAEMTMVANLMNSVRLDPEQRWKVADAVPPPRSADRIVTQAMSVRPRIEPVVLAQTTPEIRAMLDPSGSGRDVAAVYRTFARHPKLYVPRQILSEYIRTKSTLSPRVREMLILRIGWRCRSAYEWAAHAPAGRRAGLTDDQIRLLARSGYDGWSVADAAIVRAADELFDDDVIGDATWKALDDQFDERQLLDVLITTGGYRMVSMVLNTFGVPAEPNSESFP